MTDLFIIGQQIEFRSQRYMGLLTKKKVEWQCAWIRKIQADTIFIFYHDPIGRLVFAQIPVSDIMTQVEIRFKNNERYDTAKETELISLIKAGDSTQTVWSDYVDREAVKYLYTLNVSMNSNSNVCPARVLVSPERCKA